MACSTRGAASASVLDSASARAAMYSGVSRRAASDRWNVSGNMADGVAVVEAQYDPILKTCADLIDGQRSPFRTKSNTSKLRSCLLRAMLAYSSFRGRENIR